MRRDYGSVPWWVEGPTKDPDHPLVSTNGKNLFKQPIGDGTLTLYLGPLLSLIPSKSFPCQIQPKCFKMFQPQIRRVWFSCACRRQKKMSLTLHIFLRIKKIRNVYIRGYSNIQHKLAGRSGGGGGEGNQRNCGPWTAYWHGILPSLLHGSRRVRKPVMEIPCRLSLSLPRTVYLVPP